MGLFSSSQGTTTSTSTASPWKPQQKYLTQGFQGAKDLYENYSPKYFEGNTVSGFNADQNSAFDMVRKQAGGNPYVKQAGQYTGDVLSGKYLNSNPYQDNVYKNIQSHVMPSVNSQFMGSGRYGSGLQTDTATRALTEAYAPYASQQYESGMQRMDNAAAFTPTLANEGYRNSDALANIGAQQQQLSQKERDDAVARWNYYQDLPQNRLGQYMSNISGSYGSQSTSAQPYYKPSTASQVLGGAASLFGLLG